MPKFGGGTQGEIFSIYCVSEIRTIFICCSHLRLCPNQHLYPNQVSISFPWNHHFTIFFDFGVHVPNALKSDRIDFSNYAERLPFLRQTEITATALPEDFRMMLCSNVFCHVCPFNLDMCSIFFVGTNRMAIHPKPRCKDKDPPIGLVQSNMDDHSETRWTLWPHISNDRHRDSKSLQ